MLVTSKTLCSYAVRTGKHLSLISCKSDASWLRPLYKRKITWAISSDSLTSLRPTHLQSLNLLDTSPSSPTTTQNDQVFLPLRLHRPIRMLCLRRGEPGHQWKDVQLSRSVPLKVPWYAHVQGEGDDYYYIDCKVVGCKRGTRRGFRCRWCPFH